VEPERPAAQYSDVFLIAGRLHGAPPWDTEWDGSDTDGLPADIAAAIGTTLAQQGLTQAVVWISPISTAPIPAPPAAPSPGPYTD
jgi:hypothetical protein